MKLGMSRTNLGGKWEMKEWNELHHGQDPGMIRTKSIVSQQQSVTLDRWPRGGQNKLRRKVKGAWLHVNKTSPAGGSDQGHDSVLPLAQRATSGHKPTGDVPRW